jgi:hypothetical protein
LLLMCTSLIPIGLYTNEQIVTIVSPCHVIGARREKCGRRE